MRRPASLKPSEKSQREAEAKVHALDTAILQKSSEMNRMHKTIQRHCASIESMAIAIAEESKAGLWTQEEVSAVSQAVSHITARLLSALSLQLQAQEGGTR